MAFKSNFGTLLKIKIGETYTQIKGVSLVPPIESEQEKVEVTSHDQSDGYRRYIPSGLSDPGDYSFEMRSDPSDSTQQQLRTLKTSGAVGDFKIERPDGVSQSFQAYVTGLTYNEADAEEPAPVQITVALAISGSVVETIA